MSQDQHGNSLRSDAVPQPKTDEALVALPASQYQLAKIRHELRTPINHIIGYSEILEEDVTEMGQLVFLDDLKKIQKAGKQLLELVGEIFASGDGQSRQVDAHSNLPRLRTPLNHVIGYAEILQEQAVEFGHQRLIPDLQKIAAAARNLLGMLERYLLKPALEGDAPNAPAQSQATAAAPVPSSTALADWNILVVDDDAENREMLARRVLRLGYTVFSAGTGEDALKLLKSKQIDLALLDLLMPGMDGDQVLRAIKADAELAHVPVIMLSAMDVMDRVIDCIDAGAEDYISKPFNPVFLKARISAVLEKKRLRDQEKVYLQRIQKEQEKSESLLLNVLPRPIADRLKAGETNIADRFPEATVVFADVVGFTSLSLHVSAEEVVRLLDEIFSAFDLLAEKHGLEKIKTIGDAYMAACGLPAPRPDHASAAADFCLEMLKEVERFNRGYHTAVNLRVGVSSGPVVAGIIGRNKFIYDLWGDTVNTASRMESHGASGCIQVTANLYEALRNDYVFEPRGEIVIKGKGKMETYFLTARRTQASSPA